MSMWQSPGYTHTHYLRQEPPSSPFTTLPLHHCPDSHRWAKLWRIAQGSGIPAHRLPPTHLQVPYPGTVISADGDPLVLRHGIGHWCRLGNSSRDHRGCRRHGWTGCWWGLPILLCWHLQRQGLGSNHLEAFLSKSQAQGKVGNISISFSQVMRSLLGPGQEDFATINPQD